MNQGQNCRTPHGHYRDDMIAEDHRWDAALWRKKIGEDGQPSAQNSDSHH